jgi:hypothetical protein
MRRYRPGQPPELKFLNDSMGDIIDTIMLFNEDMDAMPGVAPGFERRVQRNEKPCDEKKTSRFRGNCFYSRTWPDRPGTDWSAMNSDEFARVGAQNRRATWISWAQDPITRC